MKENTKTGQEEKDEKEAAEKAAFIAAVEAKAESLKATYGKVTPIIISDDEGGKAVGFLQKPEYETIMYCTDLILNKDQDKTAMSSAGEQLLKNCLIADESDPRIFSNERKNGYLRAAFAMASIKMLRPYSDEYKKK